MDTGRDGWIRDAPSLSTEDTPMYILWWIIVGLIAGYVTGKLMKGSGYGALMDIVVGIVGAFIGGFIMRAVGMAGNGTIYTILVAILGAVILTLIVRLVTGGRRAQL
ncbi:MAG TPA: GlsB/YeaQ/YmgE family stress response membrane protein [Gemmatimonadaceae bacterium]|nr:GlsB/YeaQ/YmgE family stress response membrane protein [Gemmatimonadaceae bacterium]